MTAKFCVAVGLMGWGLWWTTQGISAEPAELIRALRAVGPQGKGNREAAQAFSELARSDANVLPVILAAFDDANPLAVNWLRNAAETIAQRELEKGHQLPAAELEKFVLSTDRDPRARRLAYELLVRVDRTATHRLIPGMLNDPSVELRRDAVQRLLDEAQSLFESDKKEAAKPIYFQALNAARDDDQVQAAVKKLGELGEKIDLQKHFGFIAQWRLIGPFDNTNLKGFDTVYPPERVVNFQAEYESKDGDKIRWTDAATEQQYGILDLAKVQAPHKGAVTYAAAEFFSDKQQSVDFRLGTPNSWKVWLNGELVFGREEYHRGMQLDQYRMRATLKPGRNVILIKLCQNEQTEDWAQRWQFQFRVCDATGTAIPSAPRTAASLNLP